MIKNDDCIYLTCENYQIVLDCGKFNEIRTRYIHLYKNGLLKFTSQLGFICDCMCIFHCDNYDSEKSEMWKCKKNNDDEYSIIINGYIYHVDKNNLKQVELFKEFARVFVLHVY